MHHKQLAPVYITLDENLKIVHKKIGVSDLFGIDPNHRDLFFAFERDFAPYQKFVQGNLPRVDLVTMNAESGACLSGLEVKLTALPDNSTYNLTEDKYGSVELV